MPATNTSRGWKEKWRAARAAGPETHDALRAERNYAQALGAIRAREEDLATLKALKVCPCGAPIPSLSRELCPPCKLKAGS